jgi:hypothetical protein
MLYVVVAVEVQACMPVTAGDGHEWACFACVAAGIASMMTTCGFC